MRKILHIIVSILILPTVIILIISGIFKFLFLNPAFWLNTFEKEQVYPSTSNYLKNYFENHVISEGGKKEDAEILTRNITPENIENLVEKNIVYFFEYANGYSETWSVYLPLGKLPPGLFPNNIKLEEVTPLDTVLSKLGFEGGFSYDVIVKIGSIVNYLFWSALSLFILLNIFSIKLTEKSRRLLGNFIPLLLGGIILLAMSLSGSVITPDAGMVTAGGTYFIGGIAIIIFPAIINVLSTSLLTLGIITILFAVAILLFKKR